MKFARFDVQGRIRHGIVDGTSIRETSGPPMESYSETGPTHSLDQVRLLTPVSPSKVLAVGLNYVSHTPNSLKRYTQEPQGFLKTPSCLIGTGDPIVIPYNAGRVEAEGELVVVMGRQAQNVRRAEALDYVLGYTCGNDISARVWQHNDLQWWRAKASDTFGPVGPWIVTDLDPTALELTVRINGQDVQRSGTGAMMFDVPTLISFFSRWMTLQPGDIIFTGTPGKPGELHPGDTVEVDISSIGVLANPVRAEESKQL